MKIVIITNIFPPHVRGGYELMARTVAYSLQERGYDVRILTSMAIGQLKKTQSYKKVPVVDLFDPIFLYEDYGHRGNPGWRKRRHHMLGGYHLPNMLALHNYLRDVWTADRALVFNPLGLGPLGIFETLLCHNLRPVVNLEDNIDGVIIDHQSDLNLLPRWKRLKKEIVATSCSEKTKRRNESCGQYRRHQVIYNGIDFSKFNGARTAADNDESKLKVVYFGQVAEVKGLLNSLEGIREYTRLYPNKMIEYHVIGASPRAFLDHFQRKCSEYNLGHLVFCHGFMVQEEMFKLISEMDVALMLLSDDEPFAFAPSEAFALGLPVILTARPGNAEAMPKGYPLMVENRSDPKEVASLLKWCSSNKSKLPALAESTKQYLLNFCDLNKITIPAFIEILENVEDCPRDYNFIGAVTSASMISLLGELTDNEYLN